MEGKLISLSGNRAVFELDSTVDFHELEKKSDGYPIADLMWQDSRMISRKQQGLIYALIRDISDYTGYPSEYIESLVKAYHRLIMGLESFSLSQASCTMEMAGRFIENLIQFCFDNEIPFLHQDWHLATDYRKVMYYYAINRKCMITGEPNAEVAHVEAVGMGRNRNKVDHTKHHIMTLSRRYHFEQHMIGIEAFMEKYKLVPISLSEEDFRKIGVKGNWQQESQSGTTG